MNTTIKSFAALLISSFVFMGGCVTKLTTVNFDYKTTTVTSTNAFPSAGTHTFGESTSTSKLDSTVKANGTSLDNLDELKLKSAMVSIKMPAGGTFDNVESVELWIAADGRPEVKIASKTPVLDGQNSVTLDVNSSEDLAPYLKANIITYRIKGTNSGPIPAMELNVEAIWGAKASFKK